MKALKKIAWLSLMMVLSAFNGYGQETATEGNTQTPEVKADAEKTEAAPAENNPPNTTPI